jgi:hypothetical protein
MRYTSSLAVVIVLVAIAARAGGAPDPAPAQKAAALFEEGRVLAEAGRPDEACAKFAASFALDPSAIGTVLNHADCLERGGALVEAWQLFDQAAAEAARDQKGGRAKFARDRAEALARRLVRITLEVADPSIPGLAVTLSGTEVASADWGRARMRAPGTVVVVATAPGRERFERTLDGAAGGAVVVDIPALAATAAAAPSSRRQRKRVWLAAGLGGGGVVAAIAGGVTGVVASKRWNRAFDAGHCDPDTHVCNAEGLELTASSRRYADASTVLFVSAAALVGAGVVLFVTAPREHAVIVTPAVTPDHVGLVVSGAL